MINFRAIFLVIGYFLCFFASLMLIPLSVELYFGHPNWEAFAMAIAIEFCSGICFILINRGIKLRDINIKDTFLLTSSSWILLICFAALPFHFSVSQFSLLNSLFEATSGLTTTGATMIADLEAISPGLHVWRALLEWVGGIGIIVMAIAVMPLLRIGGMQLFRAESSDKSEKIFPRARKIAKIISLIYLTFTVICATLLYLSGMTMFDAILHSFTTVSTGGFSTHNESIAFFDNVKIEIIIMCFILLGSIPFPIYIRMFKGKMNAMIKDQQVVFLFLLLFLFIAIMTAWMVKNHPDMGFAEIIRLTSFNVISIITTTGFTSADYTAWGYFPMLLMFFTCVIGGCTGSTTGGIKILRIQILFEIVKYQINRLIQPHGVFKLQYNHKVVSDNTETAIMCFFIVFCSTFMLVAILLAATGLDFITSISATASSLANVGPALGDMIGPSGSYEAINPAAKSILIMAMILGRLEIFTLLILFSSAFWKD
jgi:trk system potassium uptake protein